MTTTMARRRKRSGSCASSSATAHRNQEEPSRGRSYLVLVNVDLPRGLVWLRIRRYCAAVSLSPGRSA